MIYASSKDALRKALVGIQTELQGTDLSEISYEAGAYTRAVVARSILSRQKSCADIVHLFFQFSRRLRVDTRRSRQGRKTQGSPAQFESHMLRAIYLMPLACRLSHRACIYLRDKRSCETRDARRETRKSLRSWNGRTFAAIKKKRR